MCIHQNQNIRVKCQCNGEEIDVASLPPSWPLTKNDHFFWVFLSTLYVHENSTKSTFIIYHSVERKLLYKILYMTFSIRPFHYDQKIEIQKFTTNFRINIFMYIGQKNIIICRAQKNKIRFWKPVKNCIFWYINQNEKRWRGSESIQNKCIPLPIILCIF